MDPQLSVHKEAPYVNAKQLSVAGDRLCPRLDTPWQDTVSNELLGWRVRAANLAWTGRRTAISSCWGARFGSPPVRRQG